jgi:HAD superfamily hydrolase (TIGR01509 family)
MFRHEFLLPDLWSRWAGQVGRVFVFWREKGFYMNNHTKIRAVIFDMDGVLVDSEPLINGAAIAMFREKGLVVQPDDFLPFVGAGEDRYIGGVAEHYGFPLDVPSAKKRTYEIYLELVSLQLEAFPGAIDLVRNCRGAGLFVAVASSADEIKVRANLEEIGLPVPFWDAVVMAEDVVHKKPAPDIFLSAAGKLGVISHECVVVEDAVNGVQAAKSAGMRCVAVATTFSPDRLQQADVVKDRIADVSVSDLAPHLHKA